MVRLVRDALTRVHVADKAFEGLAHPHKKNIVQISGRPRIADMATARETFAEARVGTMTS